MGDKTGLSRTGRPAVKPSQGEADGQPPTLVAHGGAGCGVHLWYGSPL